MKIKISGFLQFLLVCSPFLVFGQTTNQTVRMDIIPPAPNATSLGKFAALPVGLYTGKPSIDIPLWEINVNGLKLPISLSYHAGGVKVEEIASWVGLGWALNAGGVITRSVVNLPDDSGAGGMLSSINSNLPNTDDINTNFHPDRPYWQAVMNGQQDTQPDRFYFNFAGKIGSFYLKNDNGTIKAILLPHQKIKIVPKWSSSIVGFEVTTEDGVLYEFYSPEFQSSSAQCNGGTPNFNGNTSSWYLDKITTPGIDSLKFEYGQYTTIYDLPNSETRSENLGEGLAGSGGCTEENPYQLNCISSINVTSKRLTRIYSDKETIEFIPGNNRCDLTGDKVLAAIKIYSNLPQKHLIKEFALTHSYGETPISNYTCPSNAVDANRLMLNSVIEKNGAEIKSPYLFEYDFSRNFPNRFSFAQDHWGYYNGNTQNNTFIPAYEVMLSKNKEPIKLYYLSGADRRPNLEYARSRTITKISYPTGGSTSFKYSLNECVNSSGSQFVQPKMMDNYLTMTSRTGSAEDSGTIIQGDIAIGLTKEFTVNYPGKTTVFLHVGLGNFCHGGPADESCGPKFELRDSNNNLIWNNSFGINMIAEETIPFSNGVYRLIHTPNSGYRPDMVNLTNVYRVTFSWQQPEANTVSTNALVGGLKLIEMTDEDPVAAKKIVKQYEYKNLVGGGSSGEVLYVPDYGYKAESRNLKIIYPRPGSPPISILRPCYSFDRTSSTTHPLATTHGSAVAYRTVTVYEGVDGTEKGILGKTIYDFTFTFDICRMSPDGSAYYYNMSTFPFPPFVSMEWARGLLESVNTYKKTSTGFQIVKSSINTYSEVMNNPNLSGIELKGIKVAYSVRPTGDATDDLHNSPLYESSKYTIKPRYTNLTQTTETLFDPDDVNKFVATTTTFGYNFDHLQTTEKIIAQSDGSFLKTILKYPPDFGASTVNSDWAASALAKLTLKNMISMPVEQQVWQKKPMAASYKLLKGSLTKFKEFTTDRIYPSESYSYHTNMPVSTSVTTVSNGILDYDKYAPAQGDNQGYELGLTYKSYDTKGNILNYKVENGLENSYVWDYANNYPIAEVKNANPSDIAHTSFEADGKGNWENVNIASITNTEKLTGLKSYQLSLTSKVSKTSLNPSQTYLLSFWAKAGVPTVTDGAATAGQVKNGWTYYEKTFTGKTSVELSGAGTIDELRLYPKDAQMTTYTYSPGIGMTSTTDANNVTTYYEYDSFGRLQCIKDDAGNVLKKYDYTYQIK
jgi:YD repeat-containing protein